MKHLFQEGYDERRNMNGRPLGAKNTKTLIREIFDTEINTENPLNKIKSKMTIGELLVWSMVREAKENGSVSAFNSLIDRLEGKVTDKVEQEITQKTIIVGPDGTENII